MLLGFPKGEFHSFHTHKAFLIFMVLPTIKICLVSVINDFRKRYKKWVQVTILFLYSSRKPFFLVFNCQIFSIMFRHCEKLLSVKTLSTKNSFDVLKLLILQLRNRFSYFYLRFLKNLHFSVFLISVILENIISAYFYVSGFLHPLIFAVKSNYGSRVNVRRNSRLILCLHSKSFQW